MSYCRFSSDDFACELYCYEDVNGGYTTHVAASKIENVPQIDYLLMENRIEDWVKASAERRKWFDKNDNCRKPIGLPYDGKSFNDPTLKMFKDRLIMLRSVGYHFPDYVLDMVDEEMNERANEPPIEGQI